MRDKIKRGVKMKNSIDFVADDDSLATDIACYQTMFEKYLRETVENNGRTNPEITAPILAAYNVGPEPCIMSALIDAFTAGVNAGLSLCMGMDDVKSN